MKTILKISVAALASLSLLSGCIKETFPNSGGATTGQISQSPSALESMARALPASMVMANSTGYAASGQAWDFALPAIHIALESMTGDLVISGEVGYDWFSQWGMNNALGPNYAVGALTWDNYYTWIKNTHDLILAIDEESATDLTRPYLATAYATRAMCYLDLVRLYEFKPNKYTSADHVIGLGVPIVTEVTTEAEAKNNPRAKVEDVYTLIFDDLTKAEKLFAGYERVDNYSMDLSVVHGLMARAYLERATATGDKNLYGKAADYARKAVAESGCTPLTQAQWEDPTTGFNSASATNAWMYALALPSESVYNLFNFTAHMSTEESWTSYGWRVGRAINRMLYNDIPDNDFRKRSWLDPDRSKFPYKSCRPDGANHFAKSLKSYACIKFRPAQGAYSDYKVGGAADHCLMRVEEMYFIEAEAEANVDLAKGKALLTAFMKNRITDGSYDCSKIASIDEFRTELLKQKRIEFWGEGIIFYDLKRLGVSTTRGYVGTNAPQDYRLNCDGVAPYWNFVITRGETMNNPAVADQNNPDPSDQVALWQE